MYWRTRWTRPGWMGVGGMASWETGRGRGQERPCCRGGTPQMADIREGRLGLYPLPRTVTGYLVRGCAENASKKSWAGATRAPRMAVGSHVPSGEARRDHLPFMETAPQGSQATLLTVSLVFDPQASSSASSPTSPSICQNACSLSFGMHCSASARGGTICVYLSWLTVTRASFSTLPPTELWVAAELSDAERLTIPIELAIGGQQLKLGVELWWLADLVLRPANRHCHHRHYPCSLHLMAHRRHCYRRPDGDHLLPTSQQC